MSNSLQPHGLQHARLPSPSLSPGVCSDSYPLSQWWYPSISSSVAHFSLPSIFPSIGVLSSESALHIRWSKYWNSSFRVSPLHEYSGLISFRIDSFDLSGIQGTESSPAPRFECMFVFFFSYCVLFPWWCWHCYCELKGYDIHTLAQEIFNNCCSKAGWWKVEFWRSSEQETLKGFW